MTFYRWIALAAVTAVIAFTNLSGMDTILSLETVLEEKDRLRESFERNPVRLGVGFFLSYIIITALSIPGAAILTLASGAIFGFGWGLLIASFASTIGATLAMLAFRWIFRGLVEKRFSGQLATINSGIEKDGSFYLFSLRMVPIFPFFLINALMGLTKMGPLSFFWVSQVGMLAGTILYVNAGTQLATIETVDQIFSVGIIISFALLGLFPLVAKSVIERMNSHHLYENFTKPKKFERDLVVVGAGSGGLVAALIGATLKAKVSLVEKERMGGDCLNTGCVPSKALIRSARHVFENSQAGSLGFRDSAPRVNLGRIMDRVVRIIQSIEPKDSVERYRSLGVDVVLGEATIVSPWHVQVGDRIISTRKIILATGATPLIPNIEGIETFPFLTSENLWDLRKRPDRLVVIGGGAIGVELAQTFKRLGSEVTQIEALDSLLPNEDQEFSNIVFNRLNSEGVEILLRTRAYYVEACENGNILRVVDDQGSEREIVFDQLLIAAGRKPHTEGLGLGLLDIECKADGAIVVDKYLRTKFPNIYAIGDVTGSYQYTHAASHMAWHACVNSLFSFVKKFPVDYRCMPHATFTHPEISRVGMNEKDAVSRGINYDVTTYDISELDRAIVDGEALGLIKVLTRPGTDKILGVTIAADHASNLISEYTLAMKHGIGLRKILGTIHVYPTMAEANKFVASEWAKNHKPKWALRFLEGFHSWMRGDGFFFKIKNRKEIVENSDFN